MNEMTKIHCRNISFYIFDLDLDPMTLILKLDLDIKMTYLHTKNEVPRSRHSKAIACTDRQTDTHTDRHVYWSLIQ